jgi:hypothetical protein
MKLALFNPPDPHISVFFNIETSVGRNGNNTSTEDILLVQFLLKTNGERVPAGTPQGAQANEIMKQVPLSGTVDQKTIDGIVAHQQNMKSKMPSTVVDGRVSRATHYLYGGGYFTIVALNAFLRRHVPQEWPRLQDLPNCPAVLKTKIQQIL